MFEIDLDASKKPQAMHAQAVAVNLPAELAASQLSYEMCVALDAAWKAGAECLLPLREQVIQESKLAEPQTSVADFASNAMIYKTLKKAFPQDGFISQEGEPPMEMIFSSVKAERSWIVDALDGTGTYAEGDTDEYGIHIALVDHATGELLVGVNYLPARQTTYFAIRGHGAFKQVGNGPAERLYVSSHSNEIKAYSSTQTPLIKMIYEKLGNVSFSKCFSCGLRICSQVDTPNNLYITSGLNTQCGKGSGPVRFTATWDIAPGALILSEAGGVLAYIDGSKIDYLAPDGRLTQTVVVTSDPALYNRIQQIYLNSQY